MSVVGWLARAALVLLPAMARGAAPGFAHDVQPILDANCVACHQTGAAQRGLVLESGTAHSALVGQASKESSLPLVEPGNPDHSYLVHKVSGTQLSIGGSGARMPLGGELDATAVETLKAWILGGAKDD